MTDNQSDTHMDSVTDHITSDEKRSLLNKINQSLSSNPLETSQSQEPENDRLSVRKSREGLKKRLQKEIEAMGIIHRLILHFRGFLQGKTIIEVYNMDLLQGIEKRIHMAHATLVHLKTRKFTNVLVSDFSRLYSFVLPLQEAFAEVWENPDMMFKLIDSLVALRYNKSKNTLSGFVSDSAFEEYLYNGESLEFVRKKALKGVIDYKKKFPEEVLKDVSDLFYTLVCLRNLVLFKYQALLKLAGVEEGGVSENDVQARFVPANLVANSLEEYYKLILQFAGLQYDKKSVEAVFATQKEKEGYNQESMIEKLDEFIELINRIRTSYPFDDLLRFIRKNPYYSVEVVYPRIDISDFYFSALRTEILAEVEKSFYERQRKVTDRQLQDFFKDKVVIEFQNYRVYDEYDFTSMGLPYFKYLDTLFYLLNFLKSYYIGGCSDVIPFLAKTVLSKSHILQTSLTETAMSIDNLIDKIFRYDKSLSSEAEAGKSMHSMFESTVEKRQNVRMYKIFINQKDAEVSDLLNAGVKLTYDLYKVFDKIVKNPTDAIKLQLSYIHPAIDRKRVLKKVLMDNGSVMKRFSELLKLKMSYSS